MMETKAEYLERLATRYPHACKCGHPQYAHGYKEKRRFVGSVKLDTYDNACWRTRCKCLEFVRG